MASAATIRNCRVRAGKSRQEVARHLGINDAWYHDLEQHDDELASTLTLFQAIELASFLGVRLRELMADDRAPVELIDLTELPSRITGHLARTGMSIEQFEEALGWDVHEFLESPLKVAAESPISFLQALADAIGIDWLSLVPDEQPL